MTEPKFKVGDLVTRGRGRITFRVTRVDPGVRTYNLVNNADQRKRPRTLFGIYEANLRPAEEAKS